RHDRAVVAEIADGGLGLAQSRDAVVGVDFDQAHIERIIAPEIAHMGGGGRDGGTEPRGTDGGDSHDGPVSTSLAGGQGQVKAPGDYLSWWGAVTSAISPAAAVSAPSAEAATTTGRAVPCRAKASASPPTATTAAATAPSATRASRWGGG